MFVEHFPVLSSCAKKIFCTSLHMSISNNKEGLYYQSVWYSGLNVYEIYTKHVSVVVKIKKNDITTSNVSQPIRKGIILYVPQY